MKTSILAGAALFLALAGCNMNFSDRCEDCPRPAFQIEDGRILRKANGRALLLRGVNARIEGVFDVTFDDGRVLLEPIPGFTEEDAKQMASWGLNFLRLPINWSGIEPQRDQFNDAYLARVKAIVDLCAKHGIYVLLDFHQDAYSKEIGEDGAPLWAIVPPPAELLEGPLHDLDDRRLSKQVLDAFESFFANREGLQDEFADAVRYVDRYFSASPNVVGIEILNEPISGVDNARLIPFYLKVIDHVDNPGRVWFWEPNVIRNQLDKLPLPTEPFPRKNTVYSPHIYTEVFSIGSTGFASQDPADLAPSMESAAQEAAAWNTPLFVGEFGFSPHLPQAVTWYTAEIDLQNRFLAHSAFWVWKEDSQGSWGFFRANTDGTWTPRLNVVHGITAPYPAEVEGELKTLVFDRLTATATAEVKLTGDGTVTWAVPSYWYPDGAAPFCDNTAATPATIEAGFHEVTCPAATQTIRLKKR